MRKRQVVKSTRPKRKAQAANSPASKTQQTSKQLTPTSTTNTDANTTVSASKRASSGIHTAAFIDTGQSAFTDFMRIIHRSRRDIRRHDEGHFLVRMTETASWRQRHMQSNWPSQNETLNSDGQSRSGIHPKHETKAV
ncbi:hypothetical protein HDU77_003028 [Chytriomyces hyalinus]|nr:hypothetical protein HDU77_003028 [Chytriomyces hyalinus]